CGWLLHCKRFLAMFAVIFVSTFVCPACLCGGVPLALMNSASEVPIGLSASEEGRSHSRSVLALG
ncbi:hypothetical protein, partial [Yoonia sp. R2-816]|uniref:hypothetical protein n=1 Tax=Yoonia sp. R2-816 TaxID=3342638 RepID=UPI00372A96CB